MRNQLFIITREAWASVTTDDMRATCEALHALDLYHLPFDSVDVKFHIDDIMYGKVYRQTPLRPGETTFVVIRNITADDSSPIRVDLEGWRDGRFAWKDDQEHWLRYAKDPLVELRAREAIPILGRFVRDFIITILAARNVVKETREHK